MTPQPLAFPGAVNRLVAFVHVANVDTSLEFYALLGFSVRSALRDGAASFWAMAQSGGGEIMFARASGPVDADQQAVLFYMYSERVADLRERLLRAGLHDGGAFNGMPGPGGGRRVVFALTHPRHMPAGELRIADPDGYVILVGQLS